MLTKWANQPHIPILQKCDFKKIPTPEFDEFSTLSSLRKYNLRFTLDTSVSESAYGIAYSEDSRFVMYKPGHKDLPKFVDPPLYRNRKEEFKKITS